MASQCASDHNLMADLSDVEIALVDEIIKALYPNGSAVDSAVGGVCRVYRGWPSPVALNADLAAGVVNVTVIPSTKEEELLAPWMDVPSAEPPPVTLEAKVVGDSLTILGTPMDDQLVGVIVDGIPYVYRVQKTDTGDGIAANIAAMLRSDRAVALSHSTLTLPGVRSLKARVVVKGTASQIRRRQRRDFQVCCWCPSPLSRDGVGRIIDQCLMAHSFIGLSDGTKAHLLYVSTQIFDQSQSAMLYRRDIHYKCEYVSVTRGIAPVMLFGEIVGSEGHLFT